jgi:hypothetical protein
MAELIVVGFKKDMWSRVGGAEHAQGHERHLDAAFGYRTRGMPSDDRLCTLVVDVSQGAVRITDRQEPDGVGTCSAFCGMRGSLSSVVLGHPRVCSRRRLMA